MHRFVLRIAALKWRIKLLATEKDRELLAVKLDNEAAWSKEGLLREQNKELATLRRERDHSDAERSQNIHKLSELQDHFQKKERQYAELQEQVCFTPSSYVWTTILATLHALCLMIWIRPQVV
ncbi:uncharacterized protein LOC108830240 [Raphanus sativus]|uniref:Uncharacterized protein LOC108830240 n=1 Tax=Raphanus sativus TaxID=3726 RepID=A0A6J0LI66_RAPSA|nr:uncharacterized protein LOC108830240 [Raphanus sativus]